MMKLIDAIINRRSIRSFKKERPPNKLVYEVIKAGISAPTACNLQLMEFVIITDHNLKKKIVKEGCSGDFILRAPVAILVMYDKRYHGPPNYPYIQSAGAVIENMLLRATELGLGSLWVGAIKNPEKINNLVGAPSNLMPLAFVLLGYSNEAPRPPERRRLDKVIHWNKISKKDVYFPSSVDPQKWSVKQFIEFRKRHIRFGSKFRARGQEYCAIKKLIEKHDFNGLVLDVLSSPGTHLNALGKLISPFLFCEQSREVVNFIEDRLNEQKIRGDGIVCDVRNMPFKDEEFNYVLCYSKLEQFPEPETLLKEIRRCLKKEGKLLLVTRSILSYIGILGQIRRLCDTYGVRAVKYHGPFKPVFPPYLWKMLKQAGLRLNKYTGISVFNRSYAFTNNILLKNFCPYLFIECQPM